MGRDRDAVQLRALAPLVVAATKELLGPVMLVTNGRKTIGITNSELLRAWDPAQLAIVMAFDGSELVPVANWGLGRYSGVGLVEFAAPIANSRDVTPLPISGVCASVDSRGAPSALVTVTLDEGGFVRELVPVYVDKVDGGGMTDDPLTRLASPIEPMHVGFPLNGAILFSWFPPDPVLGRKREVLAVAMAYPYAGVFKPRDLPAAAELLGLDDLGRALIQSAVAPVERPELHVVTGEIAQVRSGNDRAVLDPVEEIRKQRERERE